MYVVKRSTNFKTWEQLNVFLNILGWSIKKIGNEWKDEKRVLGLCSTAKKVLMHPSILLFLFPIFMQKSPLRLQEFKLIFACFLEILRSLLRQDQLAPLQLAHNFNLHYFYSLRTLMTYNGCSLPLECFVA